MTDPHKGAVEYGMVMPFVVCTSKGGPFDDGSFVAGYQAGLMDAALAAAVPEMESARFTVNAALAPQAELIGMRHGFPVIEVEPFGEGWIAVRLRRTS